MKSLLTSSCVVTNWPFGHRLASSTSLCPPSATRMEAYGSGTQPPSTWLCLNWVTVSLLSWGRTVRSPWPSALTFRPCCLSQYLKATSWVLPCPGVAIVVPLRSCGLLMSDDTTSDAPPEVAPLMTLTFFDVPYAVMAGLGPMYVASRSPASKASIVSLPLLNSVAFKVAPSLARAFLKNPLSRPTMALAWVRLGK
jgi:hypothetical protein